MKKILLTMLACALLSGTNLSLASESDKEINKKVVLQFYQKALNDKDFAAAEPFLGPWYIQHNPFAQDGIEGFKNYIDYLKNTFPKAHSEVKRIMADEDYVILHVHSILEPGTKGQAIVDIFRLEHHKIVEHWDVIQDIPAQSANNNGMF